MGAVVIGALLLVSTVNAQTGSTSTHPRKLLPPYPGSKAGPALFLDWSGCAGATDPVRPSFNLSSLTLTGAIRAHESTCAASGTGQAFIEMSAGVSFPLKVRAGDTSVGGHWTVSISGTDSYRAGQCAALNDSNGSFCNVDAVVTVLAETYLWDHTNNSYISPAFSTSVFSQGTGIEKNCYAGNCSSYSLGTPGSFSAVRNVTALLRTPPLNASHVFTVELDLEVEIDVVGIVSGGASLAGSGASASVSLAGSGRGGTLDWIVLQ